MRSAFLAVLFHDGDVTSVSSGTQRFVEMQSGLLPGERYELWIGCVTSPSTFRLLATIGQARTLRQLGTRRGASLGADYSAAQQALDLDREAVMERLLGDLAAAVPSE